MADGYVSTYGTEDIEAAVIDLLGGIFAGLASMANPYGIVLIALLVLGGLFSVIGTLKSKTQ